MLPDLLAGLFCALSGVAILTSAEGGLSSLIGGAVTAWGGVLLIASAVGGVLIAG